MYRVASGAALLILLLAPTAAKASSCGFLPDEGITASEIATVSGSCRAARRVATTVSRVASFGGSQTSPIGSYSARAREAGSDARSCHGAARAASAFGAWKAPREHGSGCPESKDRVHMDYWEVTRT